MSWLVDVNNVEENWILDVVNNQVVISLTIEQQSAIYATRAEEAALQAEADAITTTENATQTNLDRIATGLDVIATNADRVQTGLDRTQTGLDRTQTGLDRTQTGLDRTQTGLDRIATGEDRIATWQDRVASESAATLSTEQATIASTARNEAEAAKIAAQNSEDNAFTSASNALASENAAELAAAQIVDQVNFTGAVTGDLLERNSAGVYVPKSLKAINKSLTPFLNSPFAGFYNLSNVLYWDSFDRPNGVIETSDSGHSYVNLFGTTFPTISNKKIAFTNGTQSPIDFFIQRSPINRGITIDFTAGINAFNGDKWQFVIAKDALNYISFSPSIYNTSSQTGIYKTINGLTTLVNSFGSYQGAGYSRVIFDFYIGFHDNLLIIQSNGLTGSPSIVSSISGVFTNNSQVNYIGFSNVFMTVYNYYAGGSINNYIIREMQ